MQHLHCKDGIAPGNVVPAGLIPSQEGRGELRRAALLAGDAGFPEAEARRLRRHRSRFQVMPTSRAGPLSAVEWGVTLSTTAFIARWEMGRRFTPHADPACGGR
jgi:hypothetical protein